MKVTAFLVVLNLLKVLLLPSVGCLRCYHCKSVNLSNKLCEKVSDKTPIKDTCYYTLPNGTKVTGTVCVALRTISYNRKNSHVLLRSCIVDQGKDCSSLYFKGELFDGCPDKCNSDLCNNKEPDEMRRSNEYKFKKDLIKQSLTIGVLKGKFIPVSSVLSTDQYNQRQQQPQQPQQQQQQYSYSNSPSQNQFSRGTTGGQDGYSNQGRFGGQTPNPQDSFASSGQSNGYGNWQGSQSNQQQQFGGQHNLPNYNSYNNYPNNNHGNGNFYHNNYNDTSIHPYQEGGRSGTGDRGIFESISCFFSILEMLIVLMERINLP